MQQYSAHKKLNRLQCHFSPLDATKYLKGNFVVRYLCWRLQRVDVLSLHIVELHQGIPANGGTGSLSGKAQSLHTRHSKQVSLGAPLGLYVCSVGEEIESKWDV